MDVRKPPVPQTPEELHWDAFFKDVYNSCKCPNFKVTRSTAQAISQNTETKVTFNTSIFNNLNGFDFTNHRFQPRVPGYYSIFFQAVFDFTSSSVAGANVYAVIYGSRAANYLAQSWITLPAGTTNANYRPTLQTNTLVFLNGIDDYVDFKVYQNERASADILATSTGHTTFAQGFKISY